ncbi:MAG: hypothetical protein M5U28_53065 [Sandaracinaceae bacterium]|nr:hypothetical protein [Sandaracinaceae bacterium]
MFLLHAISITLFGDAQSSVRVLDLIFVLAAGFLIATFRRRRADDGVPFDHPERKPGEVGAACVLVACMHYTFFDYSDTAHPELWQGVFMLAAAWVITRAPRGEVSARAAFAAGVLACLAVTLKHVAALSGFVVALAAVALGVLRRSPREALRSGTAFTLGVIAVLVLTVLPFVVTGTFEQLRATMIDFILYYAGRSPAYTWGVPPWMKLDLGGWSVVVALILFVLGIAVTRATRNHRERQLGWWIALLAVTCFATIAVQKRALVWATFSYYFVVWVPFLALLAHWGLRQVVVRRAPAQLLAAALVTAAMFLVGPHWVGNRTWTYRQEHAMWRAHVRGERSWEDLHGAHRVSAIDAYVRQQRVGDALRRLARDGDTMCADGFVPALYYLGGLRCTSRYIVGDIAGPGSPLHEEHTRSLRERPPTFVVTFSDRRARIRQLEREGYVRHDVDDGQRPFYVILERRRGGQVSAARPPARSATENKSRPRPRGSASP